MPTFRRSSLRRTTPRTPAVPPARPVAAAGKQTVATPLPPKSSAGKPAVWTGPVLVVLALLLTAGIIYRVNIRPQMTFAPAEPVHTAIERDALNIGAPIPAVPEDELFSAENIVRYQEGDGFKQPFRILNDPRNNYQTTEFVCGVDRQQEYNESNPQRRAYVGVARADFARCVERFNAVIEVQRTIEIALDDTEGVNSQLQDFVRRNLADVRRRLTPSPHPLKLYLFKLTDAEYRDYTTREIAPNTSLAEAQAQFDQGLDWLLEQRPPKGSSSIAKGLFSALEMNRNIRLRSVFVFSDGMENSPLTTSFYRAVANRDFLAEANWKARDTEISRRQACPNLGYATVNWFMPQIQGAHFVDVQKYWQHVLTDVCQAKTAEVIY